RFLVTASYDKTVRLWELPSGRLLRTLRVPIGEGNDGKLYAVAISPDGGTIAVGGFTASARAGGSNIYLFDRATGTLIKRIGELPNVVTYLTYSHNGQYLAATLGDDGFRIYSTESYALAGEDRACGDSGLSADFDRAGRLVTTCYDGVIRLYAPWRTVLHSCSSNRRYQVDNPSLLNSPPTKQSSSGLWRLC